MVRSTLCQQNFLAGLRLDFGIRPPDIEDSACRSDFSKHIKIDVITRIASFNKFWQRLYNLNLNSGSYFCSENFGPVWKLWNAAWKWKFPNWYSINPNGSDLIQINQKCCKVIANTSENEIISEFKILQNLARNLRKMRKTMTKIQNFLSWRCKARETLRERAGGFSSLALQRHLYIF